MSEDHVSASNVASTSSQNGATPLPKRRLGNAPSSSRQQLRADGGLVGGPMIQLDEDNGQVLNSGDESHHGHRKGRSYGGHVVEGWLDRLWPAAIPMPPLIEDWRRGRRDSFNSPDRSGGYRLSKGTGRRKSISLSKQLTLAQWFRAWRLWRHPVLLLVFALCFVIIFLIRRNLQSKYNTSIELRFKIKMDPIREPFKWSQEPPLSGCFEPSRIRDTSYNISRLMEPKFHLISSGTGLRTGMSCHDYSNTIQPRPGEPLSHLIYHTYWRADLLPFQSRQAATVKSFLATQPLSHSRLIIWSNSAANLSGNPHIQHFMRLYPRNVHLRQVDIDELSTGTVLSGNEMLGEVMFDERGWVDGDAIRLLVLWNFGGVWVDMDQLLTRDLHPLTEHEFVTRWDCEDRHWLMLNGALMHFRKHSPYLCEAFHIMATSPPPPPDTLTWGAYLYQTLYVRLLASHIRPFSVLPWCFADPVNCDWDIRFPDPFEKDPETWLGLPWKDSPDGTPGSQKELEIRVGQIWTIHLHNQWIKEFPKGGWVDRLLQGYDNQLAALEKFGSLASRGV